MAAVPEGTCNAPQDSDPPKCECGDQKPEMVDTATKDECTCKPGYYNDQLKTQDIFWTTSIKQYNEHIKRLEREKRETEYSVNSIESTMVPFITYLMIRLSKTHPNLDVDVLLNSEISSTTVASESASGVHIPLPDLATLENFTIQDNDVLYMDVIKSLATEANRLQDTVDRLLSKENALFNTKKKVDHLFRNVSKSVPDSLVIDGEQTRALYDRLKKANTDLTNEIQEEKKRKVALQQQIQQALENIANEEQRARRLNTDLNYAGANIEIATAVGKGINYEEKIAGIEKEIDDLNDTYDKLQKDWIAMNQEAEELRNNYRKRQFKEVKPEDSTISFDCEQTNVSPACDCIDSQ